MPNARQIRGGLAEYGYKAQGSGLRKGVQLVAGASQLFAKLAASIGAGAWRGVQIDEGTLPDGTADATIPDTVNAQKTGIAQALVPASSSAALGDQAWCDATGKFIKRTSFSFSGLVAGQFDEAFTAGSAAEYRGVELFPHYVECVRPVTVSQPLLTTVLGAATVFGSGLGLAFSAAAVALYRARFTGETIRNLSVSLNVAPGGADTVTVAVMKSSDNGATYSATAVTCAIAAAAKTATDLVNSAVLTAGDIVAVRAISSAGTAAGCVITFDIT